MALSAQETYLLGVGLAMIVPAVALLVLAPRSWATWSFAGIVLFRGVANGRPGLVLGDDESRWAVGRLNDVLIVFVLALVVCFILSYPRSRLGPSATSRANLALLALAALAAIASFVRPEVLHASPGAPALLDPLLDMRYVLYMLVALVPLVEARRETSRPLRVSMVLVSLGFFLDIGVYTVASSIGIFQGDFAGTPSLSASLVLGGCLSIAAVAVALAAARGGGDPALFRRLAAAMLAGLAVGVAMTVASFAVAPGLDSAAVWAGVGLFSIAGLVSYALLRHQLFDIDLKVKWTLRRGTLAAIFLAVFVIVSQLAQAYFQQYGVLLGGIAAGALVFALTPLQRVAERVANAAMPGVEDTPQYRKTRKAEVYRGAVRLALADGVLTRGEETHLAELAQELGIPAGDALALRRAVEGELGVVLGDRAA